MRRQDLEYSILKASQIIQQGEILVIGSQAILASFHEEELPARATMSKEVDIASLRDDERETLADLIDVHLGEMSDFDRDNGFYVQGVSIHTAYLPSGWAGRVVRVSPPGHPGVVGLCLEPHDLCAAKLARFDDKDREFVDGLISAGLVRPGLIRNRLDEITDKRFGSVVKRTANRWLKYREEERRKAHDG